MRFTLGNLTFGGRIIMCAENRPTVETPGGLIINADGWPEELGFYRAHQDCICERCGREYRKHQMAGPKFDDYYWLHLLCNGDLVRL